MEYNIVDHNVIDRMRIRRIAGHICARLELGETAFAGDVRIFAKSEKSKRTVRGNTQKTVRYQAYHRVDGWRIMIDVVYDIELYSVRIASMYPNDATTHLAVSDWLAEVCR